jgi:hypothetical protein
LAVVLVAMEILRAEKRSAKLEVCVMVAKRVPWAKSNVA